MRLKWYEDKAQISRRMALVKSKWTKPERQLHGLLKSLHVRHKMHPKMRRKEWGHPDARLSGTKILLFAHGCFWHRCPVCSRDESKMKGFWRDKIAKNEARDARQMTALRARGWETVIIWEHDFGSGAYKEIIKNLTRVQKPAIIPSQRRRSP